MLNTIRSFVLILFVAITATGCASSDVPAGIGGARAREIMARGAMLIDVRSSIEFWWSHIEGAVNISSSSLPEEMKKFDKARPIIVYSRSGDRSAKAKVLLEGAGFEAYDLGAKSSW